MIIHDCQCELCCKGALPGVESHLFSEFLIKETINRQGKANVTGKHAKGNELLFAITPLENAKLFIGRQSTEEGKRVLDKEEFTEKEIEELKSSENFLTDKNLVCSICERRFQPVEDAFKQIYDEILSQSQETKDDYFELNEEQSLITELFFNMTIWRASTSKKFNLKLSSHKQSCLTELMYLVFVEDSDNKDYLKKYIAAKEKYNCLSFILFFSNQKIINPEEINKNLIYSYQSSNPYFVSINRFLVCFSENNFDGIGSPAICKNAIDNLISYFELRKTRINYISKNVIVKIGENYASEFLKEIKTHLIKTYIILFQKVLGRDPDKEEIEEMLEISKDYIGEFYDLETSDKKLYILISELLQSKLIASR